MSNQIRLITTGAEPESFKSHSSALYLGKWCYPDLISSSRVHELNTLTHPWESNREYERDFNAITQTYKEMLTILSSLLSKEHGVSESERYWQIILGVWLSRFVTIVFEHNLLLDKAVRIYQESRFCYLAPKFKSCMTPTSTLDALSLLETQSFNALLYSDLLALKKSEKFFLGGEYLSEVEVTDLTRSRRGLRQILSKVLNVISKGVKWERILLVPYLSYRDRIAISLKARRFLLFSLPIDQTQIQSKVDRERRDRLRSKALTICSENNVDLMSLILKYLPISFLEGFQFYSSIARNKTKGVPSVIINGIGDVLPESEITRHWLAQKVVSGATLITKQHGGVYGSAAFMMIEDLQRGNADLFLSWGWSGEGVMAIPKRPKKPSLRPAVNSGRVTVIKVAFPLFFYHMFPSPQSAKFPYYLQEVASLCADLAKVLDLSVNLRVYPNNFSWGIDEVVTDLSAAITSAPTTSLEEDCQRSAVAIVTYDSTSHLQLLAYNFPTLLLFYEDFYVHRHEAKPFFMELESVGVLHRSNESLITFLGKNLHNIEGWWNSDKTQNALNRFRRAYDMEDEDFANHWCELLENIENKRR